MGEWVSLNPQGIEHSQFAQELVRLSEPKSILDGLTKVA
jgi:hypothetical protein